jgi:hypothetical protein
MVLKWPHSSRIRSHDPNPVLAERVFVDDLPKNDEHAERDQQQREQSKTRSFSQSPPYLTKPSLAASIKVDDLHRALLKGQLRRFRKESPCLALEIVNAIKSSA